MNIKIFSAIVVLALLLTPAPLLPPHHLAEVLQSLSRVDWKAAYLITVFALQFTFYGCLGVLAGFSITRAVTLPKRILQIALLPLGLVALSLVIRSVKVGHPPVWVNAVVPIVGCVAGTAIGLGLLYRRGKIAFALVVLVVGISLGALLSGTSSELRVATERHLQQIVSGGPSLPSGEAQFGALLQSAFASVPGESNYLSAVQHNRAAILAWGISVGHTRLARFVGLDPDSELVRNASALGETVTLRGHSDWPKHYAVSAALAVLEHPGISDAGGLMN